MLSLNWLTICLISIKMILNGTKDIFERGVTMGDAMLVGIVVSIVGVVGIAVLRSHKLFLRADFWIGLITNIVYFYAMGSLLNKFIYTPYSIMMSFGLTWLALTYACVQGEFIIKQKQYGDIPLVLFPLLIIYFFYADTNASAFLSILFLWTALFSYFKPARIPVFFLLSVVTVGLFSSMLHNLLDGLDIVSDSSSNIDANDVLHANDLHSSISENLPIESFDHTSAISNGSALPLSPTAHDLVVPQTDLNADSLTSAATLQSFSEIDFNNLHKSIFQDKFGFSVATITQTSSHVTLSNANGDNIFLYPNTTGGYAIQGADRLNIGYITADGSIQDSQTFTIGHIKEVGNHVAVTDKMGMSVGHVDKTTGALIDNQGMIVGKVRESGK